MIRIDEAKIFSEIEKKRPRAVVLNAPEGLLFKVQDIALKVEKRFKIPAIIVGDPCYGVCDLVDGDVKRLNADLAFHIGHNVAVSKMGNFTISIDAFDDISFNQVLAQTLPVLKRYEKVGLCTISQHLHQIQRSKRYLERKGVKAVIGRGRGLLKDGQIFGCQFHSVYEIQEQVNAFIFLGQSRFHALAVRLATGKPTYMLDPYLNEVVDVSQLAEETLKKALLSIYKARDLERFGVIIGLKEGQTLLKRAMEVKRKMERLGKKVILLALREVTPERLTPLKDVDAFIQTACPRISLNGYTFNKPVLSLPQAEALIQILEGKESGDFLQRLHWL